VPFLRGALDSVDYSLVKTFWGGVTESDGKRRQETPTQGIVPFPPDAKVTDTTVSCMVGRAAACTSAHTSRALIHLMRTGIMLPFVSLNQFMKLRHTIIMHAASALL
jgi:hypothetical protein